MQTTRAFVVAAALAAAASSAPAQPRTPPAVPVYVATFIDLMPPNTASGTQAIRRYVADAGKEPGVLRVEAVAQDGRENHLVIYEVWRSQAAFDAHEALPRTKTFKATIYPLMGAPFDQRVHHLIANSGTSR